MQDQTHASLELEKTIQPTNPHLININECVEKLKNTIQELEYAINTIDETWFFGKLTDNAVKQLKKTLLRQIKKIISSTQTDEDTLSNLVSKLDILIDILNYYSVSEKKFITLADYPLNLVDYKTDIESYVNSQKKQLADKHSELEKQNQTLLNAIDENPSTQMAIRSLLTTTEAIKSNNLQLTKNVDTLTIALNTQIKAIEALKSKLTQKQSELDITKQERNEFQQENHRLKQNEKTYNKKVNEKEAIIQDKSIENARLFKENELLKISEKEIADQKSAHNQLKHEYQYLSRKVDILSDKVISTNNEKETLRRISDRKQEKIIQLQQRIHELEQTQSSSNSKKSTHRHTHSSHNRNQLFSYTLDVDYHKVGTSNDMQQTLYGPNNY